jgi:hypothetical protein
MGQPTERQHADWIEGWTREAGEAAAHGGPPSGHAPSAARGERPYAAARHKSEAWFSPRVPRTRERSASASMSVPPRRPFQRQAPSAGRAPAEVTLAERTTRVLQAIEFEPVDATAPELAIAELATERLRVTIVPRTEAVPAVALEARSRSRRLPLRSIGLWLLVPVVAAASVWLAQPVAGQVASRSGMPHAARLAANPGTAVPTGPWASASMATNYLGGGAGPNTTAPGSAGMPVGTPAATAVPTRAPAPPATATSRPAATPTPKPAAPAVSTPAPQPASAISPAPLSPWPPTNPWIPVPGHPSFAVSPTGFYAVAFGQCTWWAQDQRRDENLMGIGNAQFWASGAAARGYHVGTTPARGATVVFQPGVQGASGAGHVAHVLAVYPGGWFLVSEMNFYWNGGGWGRVDYRFAHTGAGVQFIY